MNGPGFPDQPSSGAVPFDDDTPWRAWDPEQVRARIDRIRTPVGAAIRWAVAGGWALDLFLGRITREHEDLEIVVLNDDVPHLLGAFTEPDWTWNVPTGGLLYPLESAAYTETHQTWLWSASDSAFVLDVFRDQHDNDTWICRREPSLRLPWTSVTRSTAHRVPFLIPEVVLLFKAKHARPKDLGDLLTTLPTLDEGQRAWLRVQITRVHPGHDWLSLI